MQVSFGSYEVGAVQRTPIPNMGSPTAEKVAALARRCVEIKRTLDATVETSHVFARPLLSMTAEKRLSACIGAWTARLMDVQRELDECQRTIDDLAFQLYRIEEIDRHNIKNGPKALTSRTEPDGTESEGESEDESSFTDGRSAVACIFSYAVGCIMGRWNICIANGLKDPDELPDPFDPLPACSPGMLQGPDGLPRTETPEDYPLPIDWDGILVDDIEHLDDIVRRVREVLELIWKYRAEAIEQEACEILGVEELRGYFRKPGKGGFWDDHIARYSKSRRKAPIYWLLQSKAKNYALWLYYHRLDKDLLFKALVNYVEPKVKRETNRLNELRAQKQAGGLTGKPAKKLDKEIERQEDLISELRDFEDKLRRAANLGLEPDLNDGVVLNIAPLWELVPWKEPKKYWDELMEGKYEWSAIGKQLREKGLVK